jgi:hypothetical protein
MKINIMLLSLTIGEDIPQLVVADPVTPTVTVINFGTSNETDVPVFVTIANPSGVVVYRDTAKASLAPLEKDTVTFRNFTPTFTGYYRISAVSVLPTDQNHTNDTIWFDIPVVEDTNKDIMAVSVVDPLPGSTKPKGIPFQVTATFKFKDGLINYTNVPVRLEIIPCLDSFVTFGADSLIPLITKDSTLITFAFPSNHDFESTKYLDTGCYKVIVSIMDWYDKDTSNNKAYSTFQIVPANSIKFIQENRGIAFSSNFPNPFSAATTLNYEVATGGYITMRILDVAGVNLETIMSDVFVSEGKHELTLDGSHLPSGTYFVEVLFNDMNGNVAREVQPVVVKK